MLDRRAFISGVAALIPVLAAASPGSVAAGLAEEACSKSGSPGATVGIWDGRAQSIAFFGNTTVAGRPVAVGDRWHIGSLTKSMTATLVARLVEAGRIAWTDTIPDVLGAQLPDIHTDYASVTYRDLLRHRAGMVENIALAGTLRLTGSRKLRDLPADRLSYASDVLSKASGAAQGRFLYSNAGYVVTGAMLEVTTGRSWEELIAEHVFVPLAMSGAGFGPPDGPDPVLGHRSTLLGTVQAMPPSPRADNIPALGPAGTVHLTMADMLRFLATHAAEQAEFLSPESWALLHVPPKRGEPYAMGWSRKVDGTLRHNGSNTFWYATMAIDISTSRAAAVFMNLADFEVQGPLVETLMDRALRA